MTLNETQRQYICPAMVFTLMLTVLSLGLLAPGSASAAVARAPAVDRPPCSAHVATRDALRALTEKHGLTGAALEAVGPVCGRWSAASGVADRRTGRPMRADGRIRIGSTTKTFTATVVLQLVGQGRIDLDATVEHYLPGVVRGNGYDGRRITVRNLLQHTSGLPDHVDALDWDSLPKWRYQRFTPAELVGSALAQPRPADSWAYSTTNYVLAGMIVEQVTGRDIGTEITRRIIRPLGLRDTYWPGDSPAIVGPHPRGYWPQQDAGGPIRKLDLTRLNVSFADAGGALISSLSDENRFFAALLGGRLLPPTQLRQMLTDVEADPDRMWPGARYGLGLISTQLHACGIQVYRGHGGTVPGFETLGAITPDGRQVQLVINDGTTTESAWQARFTVLRAALCETR